MKKQEISEITKNMMIGEAVHKYPETAMTMMKHGMGCLGCPAAAMETIEQGAKGHGLNDKQIDEMIKEMNKKIKK